MTSQLDPHGRHRIRQRGAGQQNATVTVSVQNAPAGARLDAWLDFNHDGHWEENGGADFYMVAGARRSECTHVRHAKQRPLGANVRAIPSEHGRWTGHRRGVDRRRSRRCVGHAAAARGVQWEICVWRIIAAPDLVMPTQSADLDGDGDLDLIGISHGIYWAENVVRRFHDKADRLDRLDRRLLFCGRSG